MDQKRQIVDQTRHRPDRVAILLIDGYSLMSFACVIEPMRAANLLSGRQLYDWRIVAAPGQVPAASNGIATPPDLHAGESDDFDTVFVCAAGNPTTFRQRATLGWLRRLARRGSRIGGVSGGPFILARAGLLEGRRATIHWEHVPAFTEAFAGVDLRQTLFEIDRGCMTCGGGVAALDMMHAIIARDHGVALAASVSDWFLQTDIRGGAGLQRLAPGARHGILDRRLQAAIALIESRLDAPPSQTELALAAGLSIRQLERLFLAALATTPRDFGLAFRLDHARMLLAQSDLSALEIALRCGFQSASHFTRRYRSHFGTSPGKDRATRRG